MPRRSQRIAAKDSQLASPPSPTNTQSSHHTGDLPDVSSLSAAELLEKAIDLCDNALISHYLKNLGKKLAHAVHEGYEQERRSRSVVISGLPEANANSSSLARQRDLQDKVDRLLEVLDVECKPSEVYRMGVPSQTRPRLVKVVFPTSAHWRRAVANARRLRSSEYRDVYLRRSMTAAERRRDYELRQVAKERNQGCDTREWVVYRGEVVRRSTLHHRSTVSSQPQNLLSTPQCHQRHSQMSTTTRQGVE
ncbi:unnamed protein product, partial [Nippostrongylus brasiliensis]|uniref:Uncharacterized protein n=1 Tax=Nippostrongylus brasiliensis TaxID=27835 RepID=A0A0N4Y154_NIPBR